MSGQVGPSGPSYSRRAGDCWIGVGLGVLTFLILLSTASGYGLSYDEPVYMSRSMRAGQWLSLVFSDPGTAFSRNTIDHLWDPTGDEQAGLMKLIAWPAASVASAFVGPLAAIRAGTMLIVSLLIGCLFVFVANLWGRLAGFFAALGLLAMPRVFTDCHLMALDAPVMAWSALSVMAACLYARPLSLDEREGATVGLPAVRASQWYLVLTGLAFGAAIATKVNGWFVPIIVLPWLFIVRRRAFWAALVSMAILGPLVFIASWPWLWFDTLARLARYFSFFGKHYPVGVTYFGHAYSVAPWHFALVMLLITTPLTVLALAGAGISRLFCRAEAKPGACTPPDQVAKNDGGVQAPGFASALQSETAPPDWQRAALGLMTWAVVVNILPSSLPSSPKYNGVRLFLPVFVPLVILAAAGFGWLARSLAARLTSSVRERRLVLSLLLVLSLAPGLYATAKTYPFGMSYYNALLGGPKGAVAHGMEATYWGDTFLAAAPWLNEKAPGGAQVWINVVGYISTMQMYQQFGLLRDDLKITGGDEAFAHANYCVVINKSIEYGRPGQELVLHGKVLYTQDLDGVPLVWVFQGPIAGNRE